MAKIEQRMDLIPAQTPNYIPRDFEGHGNVVTALAGGRTNGIAPDSQMIAVNIYEEGKEEALYNSTWRAMI